MAIPEGQEGVVQAPPLQVCPAAHACPHAPQLATSVASVASQPSAAVALQSP